MMRTIARSAALLAAVSLSLVGTVAVATSASADEAVSVGSSSTVVVSVAPVPVDPRSVVAGHEGDVLMQVSIAMPAKVVRSVKEHQHVR